MFALAGKFIKTVVPGVIKPLRVLWNEMVGFVFLVFAVIAGGSTVKAWRTFDGSGDSTVRLILSGSFTTVMAILGISSFFRARKISRT
jgi:hypothetical protein